MDDLPVWAQYALALLMIIIFLALLGLGAAIAGPS